MKQEYVIGIDLGGTKILTALADLEGNILAEVRKPTEADKGKNSVIAKIKDTIYEVLGQTEVAIEEVEGIGLGSPGPLNIEEGIIYHTPNLNLDNVNIIEELKDVGPPIFLENDANAAALGEKYFGAGKDAQDLIYVTVSTGIGGGIIIGGEVYHGASDGAGEIGHLTLLPNSDQKCGCGNYGCWEAVASGTALSRLGREAVKNGEDTLLADLVDDATEVNGAVIAKAAKKGDQVASEIVEQIAEYLGIGFASLINIFNPEKIIIGGGVSKSWPLLQDTVLANVEQRAMEALTAEVEIVTSQLEDKIGVKGAIATALVGLKELS
ncbi:transcriptional regulator/sugar kinase [Halobacteroides halobius DSM 5150]|uniref:Transcriptional regulator/sugar kinase n=1 Tax=Halobacteroides halobius (strain ATCC 35273 / DSM 5150 / MD-1) TaxID=748449 RepID=L0KBT5_HALHC|nr:ROK family protein [Halobacteroides halobius]AGB42010.1 transcriptional regulator/sugar kinase [Halobacteroides halobius DSM 5150]